MSNVGQTIDAIGTVVLGVAAIITALVGIRRGDRPKRIRERTCLVAAFALIVARGLIPDSLLGRGLYIAGIFVLAVTALWKGGDDA
jgi:hypothetical protein